jgi:hypothetical protein
LERLVVATAQRASAHLRSSMLARITFEEIVDALTANRIYSVQSVDFNEQSPAAQWVAAAARACGADLTSTRPVRGIKNSSPVRSWQQIPTTVFKVIDPDTGAWIMRGHARRGCPSSPSRGPTSIQP